MSNVLDDNVVILRFDNSDFEKNTKQSMDTLDKLKNSVSKTSGESLDGLGKATKSIDLSGLGKAIDTVNKRFSLFGMAGMATIGRLTNSAITSASKIITAVPKQAIQGGWQRALNIEQAKNLIEGLKFVWDETSDGYEKGMLTVKKAVDEAVTGTRYALDEAAIVASQLLSSGVDDTERLRESLKSISGLASVLNADYGDIGRIFAQVAGQGRMMGDDLLQLQQRGIGAADEIAKYLSQNKEVAKAALDSAIAQGRQVKKMQEIRDHAEITGADVREMVSAGAIDFDILSNSFRELFEQAERANDTYTGSLANLKSAINRIGESFMNVKLATFTKLFNALIPIFKRVKELTDPLAKKFEELGTKFTDFAINGVINPLGKMMAAKNLFKFGKAAEDAGKKVDKANKENQKSSKKSREEILKLNKEYQAARDIWYKGTYGRGEHRKNALEEIGISYQKTQDIINQFYADGFKWDNIEQQLIDDYNKRTKSSKESGEAVEEEAKKYPTMIALAKSFVNIVSAAYIALKSIGHLIVETGKALKTALAPSAKAGANSFYTFSEKVLEASKKFSEFIYSMTNGGGKASKVFHAFINGITTAIGLLGKGITFVKDVIVGFVTVIKDFFSQFSTTEGFDTLKKQLKDLIGVLKDLGGGVLEKVTDQLGKLSNVGASSNMTKVVNFFSGIAGGLADMIASIRKGENPLKGFVDIFGKVRDALSIKSLGLSAASAGLTTLSAKNGLVGSISEASKTLKNAHVSENFGSALDSVVNFIVGLSGKAKNLNLQDSLVNLFDKIKKINWSEVSKIALHFGSLFGIIASVKSMRSITDAAVGTFGSISGLFRSLSELTNTYAKKIKVAYFATIATSVAILAGCIVALSLIPTDKLVPAMAGILAAMGALVGVTAILSSDKFNADKVKKIGIGFAAMGASLALLAVACKLIASIDGDGLFKAGATILAFIGIFALASKIIGESTGAGKSFMALAGAIDILVVSLVAFAAMPWGMLLKGVAMIGIVMLELVLATRIAGSAQPKGFVGMANAINILLPAITAFSLMPFGKAMKGATIVSLIIAMLGVASRAASENAKSFGSIAALSVMIGTLTASLVILSMIEPAKLIESTLALTVVISSLAAASKFAEKSTKGILSLSLLVGVLAGSIIALIKIDAQAAIDVANSLAILAASLGIAFGIFSKIGIESSLMGLGGLAIAIGGITAIIMALGGIRQIPGATWLLNEGKKFAQQLGDAIGGFFGSIVSGFGVAATSGLGAMADNISAFSEKIQPFLEMVKGIDTSSVQGAKSLSDAIFQLTKADFVESLSVFSGVENLADRMEELGTGFVKFSEAVDQVPDDTAEKSARIADIIKTLATSFNKIPKSHGAEQLFSGVVDIDLFVGGMLKIAKALGNNGEFSKGLAELKIPNDLLGKNGKITKITEVIDAMSSAMKKMPKTGGAEQLFTGSADLGAMADGILDFAVALGSKQEGLQSLATIVIPNGLTEKNGPITKICQVIGAMSEAAKMIPESFGVKQAFTGNTTINEFACQLANSIPSLSKFINAISNEDLVFDEDIKNKTLRVAEAIGAMATASQSIPETGGIKKLAFGSKDISNFATQLKDAIPSLQDFADGLTGVKFGDGVFGKSGNLSKVTEAIKAMADVSKALPKTKGWAQKLLGEKNLGSFGKQLSTLMKSLNGVGEVKIDVANIKNTADALTTITPALKTFKENITGSIPKGDGLIELGTNVSAFVTSMEGIETSGISNKATAISEAVKSLEKATKIKASSTNNASSFTKAGEALGEAYAKGVKNKISDVKSAVKSLGEAASAKKLGKSGDFSKAGESLGKAFAKGLKDKTGNAESAGKSLGKKAKEGAKSVSLYKGGKNVGQGFVDGINAKKQDAYDAGYALGKAAKTGQKKATGESSPAKEFIKGGKYAGEGLVIGLKSYRRKVYVSGHELGKESVSGQNDGIVHALGELTTPVITPVMDLSEVRNGLSTMDNELSRNRAYSVNSSFETSDYRTNQLMNNVVKTLNKINNNQQPANNYFTFNVDGAENPEDFAKRFVRQIELEMRTG